MRVDLSFVRFFKKEEVPQDAEVGEFPRRRTGERLYSHGAAPRMPVVL